MIKQLKNFFKRVFKESPSNLSTYRPLNWVVLKIENDETVFYKVLGIFQNDAWRVNSGVVKVEEDVEHYYFYGYSGSLYVCKKNLYGVNASIYPLSSILTKPEIKLLPKSTNFMTLCTIKK